MSRTVPRIGVAAVGAEANLAGDAPSARGSAGAGGTIDGRGAELSLEADLPHEGAREGGRAGDGRAASVNVPPVRVRGVRVLARRAPRAGVPACAPGAGLRAAGGAGCL